MKLALAVVVALAGTAAADDHVVVASDARVKKALATTIAIDAACTDAPCLAQTGSTAHAKLVVAVAIRNADIELALVDVADHTFVGRRVIAMSEARLATGLAPAIAKFLDEAPTERAKELFTKGNEHYNLGEFAPALAQYKLAYRAKPLPAFLFNIAQCHRKLNQHKDAIAMYQSYLVGVPDASNKALVEDLIAESKTAFAAEQVANDRRSAEDAKLEAERLAANKKAAEDTRKAKEAEALIASRRTEQARIEAEVYDRHPARTWAMVGGGLGAGAVITGAVFGLAARSRQSAFDNAGCGDPARLLDEAALAQCVDDRDRGKRDATLGNIFLFGGGALVAASAIVFVLDPGNVERPTTVAITPSSIRLVVHW